VKEEEWWKDELLELKGLISTSLNKEIAVKYIFRGLNIGDVPVLY